MKVFEALFPLLVQDMDELESLDLNQDWLLTQAAILKLTPEQMAGPGLQTTEIKSIINSDDNQFENRVTKLTMRQLLDLVTGLQHVMAMEQTNFDRLSINLSNSEGKHYRQEQLRIALKRSQDTLGKLCSRNMRCFTQQAVQARQDQAQITSETIVSKRKAVDKKQPKVIMNNRPKMSTNGGDIVKNGIQLENGEEVAIPNFHERLAFFQNQGSKTTSATIDSLEQKLKIIEVSSTQKTSFANTSTQMKQTSVNTVNSGRDDQTITAPPPPPHNDAKPKPRMVPNVDDILLSVKLLRETRLQKDPGGGESTPSDDGKWESGVGGIDDERGSVAFSDDSYSHSGYQNADFESDDSDQQQFNHYEKLFNAHRGAEDEDSSNFIVDEAGSQGEDDFFEEDDDDKAEYQHYQYHGIEPEDAGLEVIPEEDEESLDSMCDCPIKGNDYDDEIIKSQRLNQPVDCDSGVTDDQRSNSTGDDLDSLAGDTDSAKGSMAHDVYQTSPTSSLGVGKDLETFESERPIEHKVKVHFQKPKLSVADEVDRIFHPCDLEIAENYPVTQMNSFVSNGIAKENGDSSSLEWDPTKLLKELYSTKYPEIKHTLCDSTQYVNIEGYLEKLPSGRKKATFWNPWKRKYFKAKDGYLYYYESRHSEKEVLSLQLMGGNVDTLDNNMIGVDDGKGHYLVMKCGSKDEVDRWQQALLTHCMENFVLTYVQPVMYGLRSHKDIVVIDLGSCSVRAGVLAEEPTLPQIFFPAVCATNVDTGKRVFGIGALSPSVRKKSIISFPLQPQQSKYTIDIAALPDLLIKVFEDLDIDPKHYQVQLCISRKFSMQTQIAVAQVLFDHFEVDGVNITQQSITALYSYNASSGIIVDIGSRLDILPIIDGYIVESGVTCTPYGGQRICHHLKQALNNKQYSFESNSESYLIRYALEQLCFVAQNYDAEMNNFRMDPDSLEKSVSLIDFHPSQDELSLDSERFCVTEGLFNPELWGLDLKGLHKLVHKAIMECSMDVRKEMTRSIYLCGGVTLIPGFADRLQKEVDKLTPPSLTPKVHSSPYRYHASYIGACILASNDEFQQIMVSSAEWKQSGNACLSKWHL